MNEYVAPPETYAAPTIRRPLRTYDPICGLWSFNYEEAMPLLRKFGRLSACLGCFRRSDDPRFRARAEQKIETALRAMGATDADISALLHAPEVGGFGKQMRERRAAQRARYGN